QVSRINKRKCERATGHMRERIPVSRLIITSGPSTRDIVINANSLIPTSPYCYNCRDDDECIVSVPLFNDVEFKRLARPWHGKRRFRTRSFFYSQERGMRFKVASWGRV